MCPHTEVLPAKVGLLGAQKPVFGPKIPFFRGTFQKFWSYHDGSLTGQLFGADHVAQQTLGGALEPKSVIFLYYSHISTIFLSDGPDPMES